MSMWNKKREDEEDSKSTVPTFTPKPAPPEPTQVPIRKEATPSIMSSTGMRGPEPDPRNAATIGKAVKVNGQIVSQEDLYIDGDIEGTVELVQHKLTIGPNGKVHAAIKAREVVALGSIQGNVEASEKIEIRKEAKLVGDIRTARIIIEDGAYFKGSIDIVKAEPKAAAPRPQPVAQAAANSSAPVPAEVKR